MCPHWSDALSHVCSSQQVTVNGSLFLDYAHRVPFDQVNAISIKGGVYVSCISSRSDFTQHSSPGAGCGAPGLPYGSCCSNPKVQESRLQVLLGSHLWLPQSGLLVSLSLSGTPAQAPGLVGFLSLSLSVIPLVRRPWASERTWNQTESSSDPQLCHFHRLGSLRQVTSPLPALVCSPV